MRQALKLHPESRRAAVTRIDVAVKRTGPQTLALHYAVTGRIGDLRIPRPLVSARADRLWEHTCFEAFLASPEAGYTEFNFSPSAQWAAYRFDAYRAGMRQVDTAAPRIDTRQEGDCFTLTATFALPSDAAGRLGLSAVIEETDGNKSYWALAHPPGRADFHHADGFRLELPKD